MAAISPTIIIPAALKFAGAGSAWSAFPAHDERGDMNLVSGVRRITHNILAVLLVRPGECPIHPEYGLAPEIFEPLSDEIPQAWVYRLEKAVLRWVSGIDKLYVDVSRYEADWNQLKAEIQFIPLLDVDVNSLTFNYYAYQGAVWNQDFETFRSEVHLNGTPFLGLRQ